MSFNIRNKNFRATIFADQKKFDWAFCENLQQFTKSKNIETFPVFIPSVFYGLTPQPINSHDWLLATKDWNKKIIFQSQKIDINIELNSDFSLRELENFCLFCNDVFQFILENDNRSVTRIAIAPTFLYTGTFETLQKLANSLYPKNNFGNSPGRDQNYSVNFRTDKLINGKSLKLNFVSRFYQTILDDPAKSANSTIENSLIQALDLDINTVPSTELKFTPTDVQDFFLKASNFCVEYLNFYFESFIE